jgi:hypothetical protein
MPTLTLELIAHQDPDYSSSTFLELPLVNHVHKRIERFLYTDQIRSSAVPVSYIENKELDAWVNLQISNRTYSVPANSPRLATERASTAIVLSSAYTTSYEKILVTNQTFVDERGRVRPLFFRHKLPTGVVECDIVRAKKGNRIKVDTGFVIDLDANNLFTNYRNYFDPDTGSYQLFFVVCTDADGVVTHDLLNPEPVAKLADWEDIDLETGTLTTDYPVYSQERGTGGWNFYFNDTDTWYIRPISKSLIQPVRPAGREPNDPWFMRFTAGNFVALVNDRSRRYSIPEFDTQPFIPSKPIVYSPYTSLLRVNRRVLAATRDNLEINPDAGLHVTIFVEDVDGVIIRVFTTDVSKEGERYSDTDIFYESDKITSWDNKGGMIGLGVDIHRSWTIAATYYYEADDFEYNLVSLNPVDNKRVYDHSYVFYMVPDVHVNDRSIFHLVVDHSGTIVETSQGPGGAQYPNLQLKDAAGNYNSDTIIGLKYISDIETDTFITRHTAGFQNDFGYMVVAEVTALDTAILEDQIDIDVRQDGGVPTPDDFTNVIRANPKLLQSYIGYGSKGQEVPENAVMVIDAPLTLLEDYGGVLTEADAEILVKQDMPVAGFAVVNWTYPNSDLGGQAGTVSGAELTWTWEGPGLTYTLYRTDNTLGDKVAVYTVSSPAEGDILYTDTSVVSDEVYHYSVTVTENSIEFPESNLVSVRVR